MVMSPNEWKILEWDNKPQANKQYNIGLCLVPNTYDYGNDFYYMYARFVKRHLLWQASPIEGYSIWRQYLGIRISLNMGRNSLWRAETIEILSIIYSC